MKQNRHHFFLGIFVLTGVFLLGGSVTLLGANTLFEEFLMIETYIEESVSGLERGSAVKFRGITVGKVERVTIVSNVYRTPKSYAYVLLKVYVKDLPTPTTGTLDQTLADRVNQGLRITLTSSAITGSSYLECQYVDDPARSSDPPIDWEPNELYVPSVPSTLLRFQHSLDKVLDNLAQTDIRGVVAAARDTLRTFEKSMTDLDLAGLSGSARSLLDKTGVTVETAGRDIDRLTTEINTSLTQVRSRFGTTMQNGDRTLAAIDELVRSGELRQSFEHLAKVLTSADEAMREVRALATRTDRTIAGVEQLVRGRSRAIELALGNLREILENLNSLTGTLEEYPSLLFVGNPPKARATPTRKDDRK